MCKAKTYIYVCYSKIDITGRRYLDYMGHDNCMFVHQRMKYINEACDNFKIQYGRILPAIIIFEETCGIYQSAIRCVVSMGAASNARIKTNKKCNVELSTSGRNLNGANCLFTA